MDSARLRKKRKYPWPAMEQQLGKTDPWCRIVPGAEVWMLKEPSVLVLESSWEFGGLFQSFQVKSCPRRWRSEIRFVSYGDHGD